MKVKNEKYQIMLEIQNYKKQNEELVTPLKIAKEHILQMQRKISVYERDDRRAKVRKSMAQKVRQKRDISERRRVRPPSILTLFAPRPMDRCATSKQLSYIINELSPSF